MRPGRQPDWHPASATWSAALIGCRLRSVGRRFLAAVLRSGQLLRFELMHPQSAPECSPTIAGIVHGGHRAQPPPAPAAAPPRPGAISASADVVAIAVPNRSPPWLPCRPPWPDPPLRVRARTRPGRQPCGPPPAATAASASSDAVFAALAAAVAAPCAAARAAASLSAAVLASATMPAYITAFILGRLSLGLLPPRRSPAALPRQPTSPPSAPHRSPPAPP